MKVVSQKNRANAESLVIKTIQNCNIAERMKILFLSYDGLTDPLGQSQILPYILKLANLGYNYSIISFEKKDRFKSEFELVKHDLQKSNVGWTALPYTKKPPVISTILDIISLRKSIKKQIALNQIDVFHFRSYISMFAAYSIAKKNRIKIIFDMRGFWVDERIEGGIWNKKNPIFNILYLYLKKKEKLWMEDSDLIISLTDKGEELIRSTFNRDKNLPIQVIPCCADENHFNNDLIQNEDKLKIRRKLNIHSEDIVLGYVGSIGTWYLAKEMMSQFKRLKENKIVTKFLWISPENKEIILNLASKEGIDSNDILVTSSSRSEMPLHLSIIDIGIFYIKPTFSKIASSPTKMSEMLLMGIPIICNSNVGDLDSFMTKHKVGLCHDVFKPESLKIDDVKKLKDLDANQIRSIAENELGLKTGILKYQDALTLLE